MQGLSRLLKCLIDTTQDNPDKDAVLCRIEWNGGISMVYTLHGY